ncbi:hypothetical protein B0H17DRAFT_1334567 [Mycena rosella]|uniref:ubiquitinyl hydrolase 1 n=1 Tax=Mycena rosella TaxID=1033263 RepID=A0AAD7GBP3_MYCRO|nr:hypothetical protein B0H17DRAFT_1334567 [Mycena rosella]
MQLTPEAAARQEQAEREPLPPHELKVWMSEQEKQDGNRLVEITSANFDHAVTILRKHSGDMQKAVEDLLSGVVDDPEEREHQRSIENFKQDFGHMFSSPQPRVPDRDIVIDLTNDDDPPLDPHTRFRATTRSPDPQWQMVRSTQAMDVVKSADDELNEVIQASYNDFAADDSEIIPPEDMSAREGNRPIALRADAAGKAYATLVIQALFHVPQVRQRCSKLLLYTNEGQKPQENPDWAIWELIEMFTALDLGELSVFLDIDLLMALQTEPLKQTDRVGRLSKDFLERIVSLLQNDLDAQNLESGLNRLFQFTYCRVHSPATGPPQTILEADLAHIVPLDITPGTPSNELVARLAQTLNTYHPDGSSDHQLIREASEMVTFEINVLSNASAGTTPEPFVFPKCIYMDEFLMANLDLANETRAAQRQLQQDIEALAEKKRNITRFEDRDTLEDLRGTIDYCERIAQYDTPERLEKLRTMSAKLKTVLGNLEREVQTIDEKVASLQSELDSVGDNPELRCHPYDLRAVLVHTGLPGRKHIYSYVHDKGTWWKTVDYTVTEVSEDTVLTDPAGLHLGAGPYMLMYSRRQTEEEMRESVQWPAYFTNRVRENNLQLLQGQTATPGATTGPAPAVVDEDAMDLS